ncbi:UNVERIFIED_CONTAM: Histone-lysine N-methyltransferase SUV39H1, partial [Eudyptes robustus]
YPEAANTWEPRKNLRCRGLLKQLHQDLARAPGGPVRPGPRGLPARAVSYLVQKAEQRRALRRWERLLNSTRSHRGRIAVENEVDLHGPPRDFVYINEYKVGAGISLTPVAVGCECRDCLAEAAGGCCPGASRNKFAYNEAGQVRIRAGLPIYECNSRCRCGADCPNRVVQKGIRYDLCIFRTGNGRGWGVRTLERIRKNSFVMDRCGWGPLQGAGLSPRGCRPLEQHRPACPSRWGVGQGLLGTRPPAATPTHGAIPRQCDPNLQVYNVFIENLDERLPRIALFATRPIRAGEELTFDYNMH